MEAEPDQAGDADRRKGDARPRLARVLWPERDPRGGGEPEQRHRRANEHRAILELAAVVFDPAIKRDAEAEDRRAGAERFGGSQVALGGRAPCPLKQPTDAGRGGDGARRDCDQRPARRLGLAGCEQGLAPLALLRLPLLILGAPGEHEAEPGACRGGAECGERDRLLVLAAP